MKKTMFLAIMAGAALAGCVKNEPVAKGDSSPERITFDAPVVTIPTKATEIVSNYPKDKDFGVYALQTQEEITLPITSTTPVTGTTYMDDVKCVANKTGEAETPDYWSPKDRNYYWPKSGLLTFAAYAPYAKDEANKWPTGATVAWNVAKGFNFNGFTVNSTSGDQFDLLYSTPVYNVTSKSTVIDENNPYNGVTIVFNHALSSIVFMAKAQDTYAGDKISITKITVNNVYEKGSFAQNYYNDDGTPGTPAWTVAGDLKNYSVYEGNEIELTETESPINGAVDADDTDGKRRSDLILMPQNLAGTDRGTGMPDATVSITYKITYANGNTTTETVTFNLAEKDDDDADGNPQYVWKMGYRYTYHITIGLQQIYFNPTVTPWTDVEGEVVGDGGETTII